MKNVFPLAAVSLLSASLANAQTRPDLTWSQSGTGAIVRTVGAKLKDNCLNVKDFGAVGDGVTDDGAAIQRTFAAAQAAATNHCVEFPAGTFVSGRAQTYTNAPLEVWGKGQGVTAIRYTSATAGAAGISISENSYNYAVRISGLSLLTGVDQANGNSALSITYPSSLVSVASTISFSDLEVSSGSSNPYYWANGIVCANCGLAIGNNFSIRGKNVLPGAGISANMSKGISLTGYSTDTRWSQGIVALASYGMYVSGTSEDPNSNDVTMLGVNYGWYFDDSTSGDSTSASGKAGPHINNSHCNAYFACVVTKGWQKSIVGPGNLFYKFDTGGNLNYVAVQLLDGTYSSTTFGSNNNVVQGNTFSVGRSSSGSGTAICAQAGANSDGNLVINNQCILADYFADLSSAATKNIIKNNQAVSSVSGWIRNGVSAYLGGNLPVSIGTELDHAVLASNSTSPSVGAVNQSVFYTNSSSATSITALMNGFDGQILTIVCADTNTTLVHQNGGAGVNAMTLASGTNYVCPRVSATISLIRQTSQWRETGRTP